MPIALIFSSEVRDKAATERPVGPDLGAHRGLGSGWATQRLVAWLKVVLSDVEGVAVRRLDSRLYGASGVAAELGGGSPVPSRWCGNESNPEPVEACCAPTVRRRGSDVRTRLVICCSLSAISCHVR